MKLMRGSYKSMLSTREGIETQLSRARAELAAAEHALIGTAGTPKQRAEREGAAEKARRAVAALERLLSSKS